jgi:hypothetical protein
MKVKPGFLPGDIVKYDMFFFNNNERDHFRKANLERR